MLNRDPATRNPLRRGEPTFDGGRGLGGPGELELLSGIRQRAEGHGARALTLGIGDDCALLRPRPGEDLAVTTDLSVAGRHFRLEWHPAASVGHRTLARGLSDLASMGARPLAAFLSLGLPRELTGGARGGGASWLDRFLDGFFALANASQAALAGGDLAESPVAAADIVLIGAVPRGRALLRSGARAGEVLYMTGTLGGAAAAFQRLSGLAEAAEANRRPRRLRIPKSLGPELVPHLYPQPRLAQGQWLMRRRVATAAIDISDGLSTDLGHLCEESGVAAEVRAEALPVHAGATLEEALHGGEEYELLFTAPASARVPRSIAGVPITAIGRILRRSKGRPQVTLVSAEGSRSLEAHGWQHFK
jgi:thiamine-monophosphate kinase